MALFFVFFFLSGFCSLVYQVAWLRAAMGAFGVTTPSVSLVLSVFMGGLALGSWLAGRLAFRLAWQADGRAPLRWYAAAEAIIGVSGLVVVPMLHVAHSVLIGSPGAAWGSAAYYAASGALVGVVLLPFCTCMGATFPLAMAAVRRAYPSAAERSFSFLYVANVLGAMAGCLSSAFLLFELFGFRATQMFAAALNVGVAIGAWTLASRLPSGSTLISSAAAATRGEYVSNASRPLLVWLFISGLTSLAMEVIWTRQFVPYTGPVVYTFAGTLAVYLGFTVVGSRMYRGMPAVRALVDSGEGWRHLAFAAGVAALLPLAAADYRLPFGSGLAVGMVRIALGIGPFCLLLGVLTPGLVDKVSGGDAARAGTAYALNTVGCILGPLAAGFVLLPWVGERWSLLLLSGAMFVAAFLPFGRTSFALAETTRSRVVLSGALVMTLLLVALTRDFDRSLPGAIVHRDHTATVIAVGEGRAKQLLVNGYGMTVLTPVTKMMVHLTMAAHDGPVRHGLVLCLGMGTSFRSMLSWQVPSTVVELVPSIPVLLPFFHADGAAVMANPLGTIVVDDARRYLERSGERFDVILVDPPPPVEAATSSLLYSTEFYAAARRRLAEGGVFQAWIPTGQGGTDDMFIVGAMLSAAKASFPYVRVFRSFGGSGLHVLASDRAIDVRDARVMASRLPAAAVADLLEWGPFSNAEEQFADVVGREMGSEEAASLVSRASPLSDDRPVNEYYMLRRLAR